MGLTLEEGWGKEFTYTSEMLGLQMHKYRLREIQTISEMMIHSQPTLTKTEINIYIQVGARAHPSVTDKLYWQTRAGSHTQTTGDRA